MRPERLDLSLTDLKSKSSELRLSILDMVYEAASGHVDSSFSCTEILTALYFKIGRFDPNDPTNPLRDRLVLSKGHAAPALYAVLANRGFFPASDLRGLRDIGSHLQGHPRRSTPGVDCSTGSLGQGLSIAAGMAYASQYLAAGPFRTFAVLSDGELGEGQVWEAALFASMHHLSSLTCIVDANGLQYSGRIADVLALEPLSDKWRAFGWEVSEVDGHDFAELVSALELPTDNRPKAILARTTKGKGVAFMENNLAWHGKAPSHSDYLEARRLLRDE